MRTVGKALQGRSVGAQGKVSISLQKLRPWVLALGKGEEQGGGEKMGPQRKGPWDRWGQGPGEGWGGEEKKPKLDYLLDFLCTPELEGRKGERGRRKN